MDAYVTLLLQWVVSEVGGLQQPPWSGMRTLFLWQDRRDERIGLHKECESTLVSYDPSSKLLVANARIVGPMEVDPRWLEAGTHIELSAGPRIVALGRIIAGGDCASLEPSPSPRKAAGLHGPADQGRPEDGDR